MTLALDWQPILDEAQTHFLNLLRIDTTNPPGNEQLAVDYLRQVLDREGLEYRVVETAPGRACITSRMRGAQRDSGLMMTSHLDVVPVDREHWRTDPFGAEILDGEIYGRGAIDMKNVTAYSLATFLTAKRQGWKLEHDLIFNAFADEEAGCTYGSRHMVEKCPELIACKYALNELGGFTLHLGGHRLYPVQVAEKGFVWLKMRVEGDPGHGSMPHGNNAVVKLSRAIDKLDRVSTPLKVHPIIDGFLDEMGKALGPVPAFILKLARHPRFSDLILKKVMPDKEKAKVIFASLHDTVNPTGLAAGKKVNVIPSVAEVTLDCRVMPGTTRDELIREITDIVGPGFTFEVVNEGMGIVTPFETPMWNVLQKTLEERDPGARAVPYLIVGLTDDAELSKMGIRTYGFSPVRFPPGLEFSKLYHGHNERIPVEGFRWGVQTFMEAVHRYCVSAG